MAQKVPFKSVVYFNLAGSNADGKPHGVTPGIVLTSRMEQIPGTQDLQEVLSVLYAHPDDEQHAVHRAKDIGDVKFSVKPISAKNHFGWADAPEGTVPPEAEVAPDPVATEESVAELPPPDDAVATLPPAEPAAESTVDPDVESTGEVFADAEGKTIGKPDGEGGFTDLRTNPFPPSKGKDWTGHPITERIN